MNKIFILARKDLKIISRDKFALFWLFVFPLIFAIFFGVVFPGGGDRISKMNIALVDEDNSEHSRQFIEKLKKNDALEIEITDVKRATEQVRLGKKTAYIILKEGFGKNKGFFSATPGEIELGLDPSGKAEGGSIQGILVQTSFQVTQDIYANPEKMQQNINDILAGIENAENLNPLEKKLIKGIMGTLSEFYVEKNRDKKVAMPKWEAVNIKTVAVTKKKTDFDKIKSSFEITFPLALAWALMGCSAGFAISMVTERVYKTYHRLKISPLSSKQILAGKALACFLTCMTVIVFLLLIGHLFFKVRLENSVVLIIATITSGICFTGLMMLISVIGKTEQAVAGAGWAIMCIMAMIGGGMVPLFVMPNFMKTISNISPVKWSIISFEGAIWREFSIYEILLPATILILVGIFSFVFGVLILSKSEK